MFEQEIEMEQKEGSAFGPVIVVLILVALFIGGLGVVIYQGNRTLKPEEATAAVQSRLQALAPATVTFRTGNVNFTIAGTPSDPQYKLLEKAGMIKIGKPKADAAPVELTPAGKDLLAALPDVKGVPGGTSAGNNKDTTAYTLPLARRHLVSVDKITKLGQNRFQVQYTWSWQTTKAGDLFDIGGKVVQSLPQWDRLLLIDQHGADYYHAAPTQASIVFIKGDHGWEPASAN
jgi:hypothetical protein